MKKARFKYRIYPRPDKMPISQAILLCTCSLERQSSFRPLKNTNIEKMKNIIDKTKKYLKSFDILLVLKKHKLSFLIPAFDKLRPSV